MNKTSLLFQIVFTVTLSFVILFVYSTEETFDNYKKTLYELQKEKIDVIIDVVSPLIIINVDFGLYDNIEMTLSQLLESHGDLIGAKLVNIVTNETIYENIKEGENSIDSQRVLLDEEGHEIASLTIIYSNNSYKKAIDQYYYFILKGVVVFILFLILFIYLLNYLFKPLEDISFKLSQFSLDKTNTYNFKILKGKNEVTIINNAVFNMVERIKDSMHELVKTNEKLEIRVEERTKELKDNLYELKETQNQLVQTEKMASLGGLVAGVAHEINTPVGISLTAITHLHEEVKLLQKLYKEENMSEEEFEYFLKKSLELTLLIENNLGKTANLVKSFKQVAVDQTSEENRKFNLKEYVTEILMSLHSEIKKTKIVILIDIDKNILINSNPGAFSQIITNLVLNSLIHGYDKGAKGEIKIEAFLEKNRLVLIYSDDGKGLNSESKIKIFDPFFTTNREHGGSGLGMNIVYNVVTQKLHGSIDIVDEVKNGVMFKIVIGVR